MALGFPKFLDYDSLWQTAKGVPHRNTNLVRPDEDDPSRCSLAWQSKNEDQTPRRAVLASIYDGSNGYSATSLGRVGLLIIRDWVLHSNTNGSDRLIDYKTRGSAPKLNAAQRQPLAENVVFEPAPAVDGVVRGRLKDLMRWIFKEFGISVKETAVGKS
ncbi:hypothetical protein P7L66_12260 [Tistrella mobilis]|uniref:hypothetical protein n=1 Tax=Tistrella mobilis TaxID=171437 RepID=UPI003555E6E7